MANHIGLSWLRHWAIALCLCFLSLPYATAQDEALRIEDFEGMPSALRIELGQRGSYAPSRLATLRFASDESLRISFDRLGDTPRELSYRIVGCQSDGSPSELSPIELLGNWTSRSIDNYRPSMGTAISYTHYQLEIGVRELGFKRSGRYAIEIYDTDEEETTILSIPLWVYKPWVGIEAKVLRPMPSPTSDKQQAIELCLALQRDKFGPHEGELSLEVIQNASLIGEVIRPTKVSSKTLERWCFKGYDAPLFWGNNEYFRIEHSERNATGIGIERSSLHEGIAYAYLYPNHDQRGEVYTSRDDRDGIQQLRSNQTSDYDHEGQYHLLTFRLKAEEVKDCDVVLEGEAFDCLPLRRRTLRYNPAAGEYRLTLPLKNGTQEYRYALRPKHAGEAFPLPIGGSHYETQNRYDIFVYLRGHDRNWQELIGIATL